MSHGALWPYYLVVLIGMALTLASRQRGHRLGIWVFKPIASGGFIALALAAGALDTGYGQAVLVALCLCFVGDVLLIPKARAIFLAGLISFLLGHVGYLVAFWVRGFRPSAVGIALLVLVPVALLVGHWLYPHVSRRMRVPVFSYIVVITLMVAAAAGVMVASARPIILVGALSFFLSDISVARERFVEESFINRLWGLPLYYGGQVLLALSVAGPVTA